MNLTRKDFVKKACISGACLCGFTTMLQAQTPNENEVAEPDPNQLLMQEWISTLLFNMDEQQDEKTSRSMLRKAAAAHYKHLNMDEILKPYEGDLEKFNAFIENEWGWKIDYQKEAGLLVADENKNYCVCPLVNQSKGIKSGVLCYCSEGFAELMFSKVIGKKVETKVLTSVLRGNDHCRYEIRTT
ncbi:MAG TPA: DUF6144 family protein [Sunxiuqinia sp.]|nr:DUF6144 family protein [Sunxiuqinia sp.]